MSPNSFRNSRGSPGVLMTGHSRPLQVVDWLNNDDPFLHTGRPYGKLYVIGDSRQRVIPKEYNFPIVPGVCSSRYHLIILAAPGVLFGKLYQIIPRIYNLPERPGTLQVLTLMAGRRTRGTSFLHYEPSCSRKSTTLVHF